MVDLDEPSLAHTPSTINSSISPASQQSQTSSFWGYSSNQDVSSGHDPALDDILMFFRFSHRVDADWHGAVAFELKYDDGVQVTKIVEIKPKQPNTALDSSSDDVPLVLSGRVLIHDGRSCSAPPPRVSMAMHRDTFFQVYMGQLDALKSIVTGQVKVRNWAFSEVKSFSQCFDLHSDKWREFYDALSRLPSLSSTSSVLSSYTPIFPFHTRFTPSILSLRAHHTPLLSLPFITALFDSSSLAALSHREVSSASSSEPNLSAASPLDCTCVHSHAFQTSHTHTASSHSTLSTCYFATSAPMLSAGFYHLSPSFTPRAQLTVQQQNREFQHLLLAHHRQQHATHAHAHAHAAPWFTRARLLHECSQVYDTMVPLALQLTRSILHPLVITRHVTFNLSRTIAEI